MGGPDYGSMSKVTDAKGDIIEDATGRGAGCVSAGDECIPRCFPCGPMPLPRCRYRYFGAARNLPGVKELFEKQAPRVVRRTRAQMYQLINADYYGFRDEEDGVLERVEAEAEARLRARAVEDWEAQAQAREAALAAATTSASGRAPGVSWGMPDAAEATEFVAYVPLPDAVRCPQRLDPSTIRHSEAPPPFCQPCRKTSRSGSWTRRRRTCWPST